METCKRQRSEYWHCFRLVIRLVLIPYSAMYVYTLDVPSPLPLPQSPRGPSALTQPEIRGGFLAQWAFRAILTLLLATTCAAYAQDQIVYDDALENGWSDWS